MHKCQDFTGASSSNTKKGSRQSYFFPLMLVAANVGFYRISSLDGRSLASF